jgi:hypothetical protein
LTLILKLILILIRLFLYFFCYLLILSQNRLVSLHISIFLYFKYVPFNHSIKRLVFVYKTIKIKSGSFDPDPDLFFLNTDLGF